MFTYVIGSIVWWPRFEPEPILPLFFGLSSRFAFFSFLTFSSDGHCAGVNWASFIIFQVCLQIGVLQISVVWQMPRVVVVLRWRQGHGENGPFPYQRCSVTIASGHDVSLGARQWKLSPYSHSSISSLETSIHRDFFITAQS